MLALTLYGAWLPSHFAAPVIASLVERLRAFLVGLGPDALPGSPALA